MNGYVDAGYVVAIGTLRQLRIVLARRRRERGRAWHGSAARRLDAERRARDVDQLVDDRTGRRPRRASAVAVSGSLPNRAASAAPSRRAPAHAAGVSAWPASSSLRSGFLLYKGVTSAVVYFKTAQQAVLERATLGNSTFQIEGDVVPGSRRVGSDPSEFSFAISSGAVKVEVHNTGVPPQLFGPGVPVVLVGHFVGATDTFASDQILIKHSNSYIAAHPARVRGPNGEVH